MNRKNTIMILAAAAALIGTGTLLVADSVSFVGRGGSGYAFSQSHNKPLYLRGCLESDLPECGLVVW